MSKVRLMLTSVRKSATKNEIKSALAELYNKPESHFEPHCKHLFDLKKPFELLKEIDFSQATQHCEKLEQVGIECVIEESADKPSMPQKRVAQTEGDISAVNPASKNARRIMYAATAGVVMALGGGYLAHTAMSSAGKNEPKIAAAKAASDRAGFEHSEAPALVENKPVVESALFSHWRARIADIEKLKHQLDALNNNAGLSSTMTGLINGKDDPLVRTIGEHYVAKLAFPMHVTVDLDAADDNSDVEFKKTLSRRLDSVGKLPTGSERLYAALDLGKTYQSLGLSEEATAAYARARSYAVATSYSDDARQKVISEVIAAEFLAGIGQQGRAKKHYNAAVAAAGVLDSVNSDSDWAIAFVVSSEASVGRFADAYDHSEEISDGRIEDRVLAEVSKYVDELETDVDIKPARQQTFADDPDLMLLFENTKKFKESAGSLPEVSEQPE